MTSISYQFMCISHIQPAFSTSPQYSDLLRTAEPCRLMSSMHVCCLQVVMRQEGILDQVIAAEGFAVGKGIGGTGDSSGQLWFNGLLSSGSSNWRSSLFMALQGEMQNLQVSGLMQLTQ